MTACTLSELPNWVQALAAAGLVVMTFLTLIVLKRYAADTKTIAENSSRQVESSQMPFIALVQREPGHSSNWAIKNQGFGPAINIQYTRFVREKEPPLSQWVTPLAPSEQYSVENKDVAIEGGFKVDYESLSGKKYRTIVARANGKLKQTFQRLA